MVTPICSYEHCRDYLSAWLAGQRPGHRVRALARRIGCAPSTVSMIRKGKRRLNPAHGALWAWGLRLDDQQADYWEHLVVAAEAKSEDGRERARLRLAATREWQQAVRSSGSLRLCARWYYMAIVEAARCCGFRADPAWLAARLYPSISPEEAREALDTLTELGLLDPGGQSSDNHAFHADIGHERADGAMATLHRDSLAHAAAALRELTREERYLGSFTFAVPTQALPDLIEELERLHLDVVQAALRHGGSPLQ